MSQQNPSSNTENEQHTDSRFNRIPVELQDMVFGFTDTVTKFLNGKLKNQKHLDDKTKRSIWVDVFSSNWNGDLSLLPYPPIAGEHDVTNADLALVSSRDMYDRLCNYFPHATESNKMFVEVDKRLLNPTVFLEYRPIDYLHVFAKLDILRLLHIPMRNMWLELLHQMIDENPYAIAYHCVHRGHHDLLLHLINTNKVEMVTMQRFKFGTEDFYSAMDMLAMHGYFDVLRMFHGAGCRSVTEEGFHLAAKHGHLDVLIWLYENYPEQEPERIVYYASSSGHLHVLKWLYENREELAHDFEWFVAARDNQLAVIKWYHEMDFHGCSPDVMDVAAANGNLDVIKWLHQNRTEGCTEDAINHAAHMGQLQTIRWLLDNRTEGFTDIAVQYCKNVEVAELLISKMNRQRRISMLRTAKREDWRQFVIDALQRSISK